MAVAVPTVQRRWQASDDKRRRTAPRGASTSSASACPTSPASTCSRTRDGGVALRRQGDARSASASPRHFSGPHRGGLDFIGQVASIDFLVTETEAEALLAEQQFIKRHRPILNIRLRDDKSYPYIGISLDEEFPRVYFTRERHRPDRVYFGPFSSARRVRETLDLLGKLFQYRTCEGPEPGRRSGVPCLDYYIKRCRAPCVGYIDREEYGRNIEAIVDFLSGRYRDVERDLSARWTRRPEARSSSGRRSTGTALEAVRSLMERQQVAGESVGTADLIGGRGRGAGGQRPGLPGSRRGARRAPGLLPRQRGRATSSARWPSSSSPSTTRPSPTVPPLVVVGPELADRTGLLAEALGERRGDAGRGARRRARRQAPAPRARRAQRQPRARRRTSCAASAAAASGRGARRARRGARDGRGAGPDRGLRHLQPRARAHGRLDGRLRGRGRRRSPTTAASGSAASTRTAPDDFAAMNEVLTRRLARYVEESEQVARTTPSSTRASPRSRT